MGLLRRMSIRIALTAIHEWSADNVPIGRKWQMQSAKACFHMYVLMTIGQPISTTTNASQMWSNPFIDYNNNNII